MAHSWTHNMDEAEDIVQDTMVKALLHADKPQELRSIDSWLFKILYHCFIDAHRKQRTHNHIDDDCLFTADTPEYLHSQREMLLSVRKAISRLPINQRQVVTLVDLENFTYAEVAEITGVPIGTVMSRLNRARQSLKQLLSASAEAIRKELRVVK
jgi:RNA polymerase sigma-70 factor (ECF subfamily)